MSQIYSKGKETIRDSKVWVKYEETERDTKIHCALNTKRQD